MNDWFFDVLGETLGYHLKTGEIQWWQMVLRTVITFIVTIIYVRIGNKRFISQNTALDLIVGIMLGSTMATAMTGSLGLMPVLAAGLTLVLLHRLTAALATRLGWFGPVVKGHSTPLIRDGQVLQGGLRSSNLTEEDLREAMRLNGYSSDPSQFESAHQERSGSISFVPKKSEPRVLEVKVEDGVQTVRIRLE